VACANRYPAVGGIPVLMQAATAEVAHWGHRLHEFVLDNNSARASVLAQLASEAKLDTTRRRLEQLHDQLAVHRERIVAALEHAGVKPTPRSSPDPAAVLGEGTITAYYHQIHRDWAWAAEGNDEVAESVAAVSDVIAEGASLGTMVVLGAGAARLAYELHRTHDVSLTIAIDINPLPALVARRLIAGETVPLFELPIRPRDLNHVCVDHQLQAPAAPTEGFELLFADGLEPPIDDGQVDTVLTPWFIDQIPTDLAMLVPEIRRILRPGGCWLNFGPLVYHPGHTRLVHRYGHDEVLDLVTRAGFAIESHSFERMKYMQSPSGCQGRTEMVLTFCARKGLAESDAHSEPSWLEDLDGPVPIMTGAQDYQPPHPLFAAVLALVDGARSMRDIAAVLIRSHGLPDDAATPAVQTCLREIDRQLRR